ncbi:MAG: MBL fold metallo-hydrolase RNA specificity domain-containing protein, partial [Patescibacteria group bacterium]|nr:MBL fold metallo-hydrolase RNA specificity domain-containing protein [Patescibacteria group bacterium]
MRSLPIYMDSPLASRVTDVFRKYTKIFNKIAQARINDGDDLFSFPGLEVIKNTGESRAIHKTGNPKIIIAGAGMSSGGRIRSHEREYLGDKNATVLFVGYQTPGSLGRRIQDGAREVEIDGARVKVRARIERLGGYSGHADRDQLLDFIEHAGDSLEKVFVVMGEPKSSIYLAQRIHDFFGISAAVPEQGTSVELEW